MINHFTIANRFLHLVDITAKPGKIGYSRGAQHIL